VIVDAVTQRYADALWGLAQSKGSLATVVVDVGRLAELVRTPAVRDALTNPRREREERRRAVTALTGALHPFVQNLVEMLFDKQREEVLLGLGDAFHKLGLEQAGQVEGVVESARPLGAAEMEHLASALGPQFGKQLLLSNTIVPELVGGARVLAGNRMIDYSVQGRLEALRRKLMDAPLPSVRA
jgi:F-type H+-transporting ATPase subunit delta